MNSELIAAIDKAAKILTRKQWRDLRCKLRRLAGLLDDTGSTCYCGKRAVCKSLCAKHYYEQRDRNAPPCECGKPIRAKGVCKACYQKAKYKTLRAEPCTAPRHQWTNQGTCKVCKARRYRSVKIEV